ncbi:MAG: amino acid adenylation domain-containing protein [bacterium]|nr:amino acid adenylation domain-containing protein [bacterium]
MSKRPWSYSFSSLRRELPTTAVPVLCLDTEQPAIAARPAVDPAAEVAPGDLAYLIYTSGSTGKPKGVAISHHNVVTLLRWSTEVFAAEELSAVLAATSICFDLSVFEIFAPLTCGGRVILAGSVLELPKLAAKAEITLVNTVPSAMAELVREGLPESVVTVNLAGETLSGAVVEELHRQHSVERVCNLYGPSEDTTYSTFARMPRGESTPAIGRPVADTRLYLVDGNLELVPLGVTGEILLGGAGLARGYHHRPALTAERWVPDSLSGRPGARLYRTGDLGRCRVDGQGEFLGRIDHQVKVRSFRIELGEIETVLATHPAVERSAVVAHEEAIGDRPPLPARLVAYVVGAHGGAPPVAELRELLKERLPEYMVPATFLALDTLPATPGGKVDRTALSRRPLPSTAAARPDDLALPQTPVEEMLAEIWAEVLGLERPRIDDSFFDLGGHSLMGTQVISRVRELFGVELPLRRIFEAPTVAELAAAVELAMRAEQGLPAPRIQPQPRAAGGELPLSFAQQRLWLIEQLHPGTATYNLPTAVRLRGTVAPAALRQGLDEVVRRHEVLRTTFGTISGRPVQVIRPPAPVPAPLIDLSRLAEPRREAALRRLSGEEASRPFDLERGPLLRSAFYRLAAAEHVVLVTMHHIVSDGWSMGIFVREVTALYQALSDGRALCDGRRSVLPELPIQYADFAAWQRRWLEGEVLEAQLAYWRTQLAGAPALVELPCDRPRSALRSPRGASVFLALPEPVHAGLRALARSVGVTPFMTLLAAFQTLLGRCCGQRDVVVGTPIAGRTRLETEGLIGFFVNTLVLRGDLKGHPSFRDLLHRAREVVLDAYAHQDLPFEKLVEELVPERNLSQTPLFQVMLLLQNAPREMVRVSELEMRPLALEGTTAKFDLSLSLTEHPQGLTGGLTYSTDLFDASTIARMAGHFCHLLAAAVSEPDRPIGLLPWWTAAERHQQLVAWNDTRAEFPSSTLHGLFAARAADASEAVAVVFGDEQLSYGELDARANQLAHHLRARGVGSDSRVGICMKRSLKLMVGLMGILKAGGAYLPLDPAYPRERLRFMLEDARISALLTESSLRRQLPAASPVVCLDTDQPSIAARPTDDPVSVVDPRNLAYVIYTSGSTGKPKGVEVPHLGVLRLLFGSTYAALDSTRTLLQAAPVAFDASTFEVWGALLHGGRCVLMPQEVPTPPLLRELLRRHRVDTLWLTASLFNTVVDEDPEILAELEQLLIGGEALSAAHVRRYREHCPSPRLINGYGPTESTTFTCCHPIGGPADAARASIPIGRPIANTRVVLLDERREPVLVGTPGELCVGGPGLARGYQERPALTAVSFVPDPFSSEPGMRMYRTGDLGRYLPDGRIEFLGRIDHQVKVRGYRIELGEIEAVLSDHPAVDHCAVVAREEAVGGRRPLPARLVAYVVAADSEPAPVAELRQLLKQRLPEYMVPAAYVTLDTLPLTPSGKVDRAALGRRALPAPGRENLELRAPWVAPRDPVELRLTRIWEELLGVGPVGVKDHFFALGGHSLLAVQLVAKIKESFHATLPLTALFNAPTVEALAGMLKGQLTPSASSLIALRPGGTKPPLFCVHPIGGTAFCYLALARHLGSERPIYGLQSPALDSDQPLPERIEDMAAHYIRELRAVQPEGPYFLAGWSMGGNVAYEMAQQLTARGHRVAFLGMIDAAATHGDAAPMVDDEPRLLARFALEIGLPIEPAASPEPADEATAEINLTELLERGKRRGLLPADVELTHVRRLYQIFKANLRALCRYLPRPYSGAIHLFMAAQPLADDHDLSTGWKRLVSRVTTEVTPGNHFTAVREPHVEALARQLAACLQEKR